MQFGGNAQGEGEIKGVVMSLKRTCIGTAGFALQHRCLNFKEVPFIQPATDATHQPRPAAEGLSGVRRHDQIEIALAIALLHIGQAMPLVRQRLQRLGEHAPIAHLHRQLTAIGAAQGAAHPKPVTSIDQTGDLFEPTLLLRLQTSLLKKQLNGSGLIRQGEKGELAHHPPRHHATGDGHRHITLLSIGEISMGLLQGRHAMGRRKTEGIGPLPQISQYPGLLQTGVAQLRHSRRGNRAPSCPLAWT